MKRRDFLQTAAALSIPMILPSGRLFAASGNRPAGHVVLCLFAGGVRNMESLDMQEGNLMPNLLKGDHRLSADIRDGFDSLPPKAIQPLQKFGTLYRNFRFSHGPTAHVSGHLSVLTGKYFLNGHNPKYRSPYPTLFEYFRKHSDPVQSAMEAWWIAERNDPFNICSFSANKEYGAAFGANYFHPGTLLRGNILQEQIITNQIISKQQQAERIKNILDKHSNAQWNFQQNAFHNSVENREKIDAYIRKEVKNHLDGKFSQIMNLQPDVLNEDLINVFFATRILNEFRPRLLVVNMMGIDRGHTDFTLYCNNIRKADYALRYLWDSIQQNERLKNDTVLIAVPEHGRNLEPNSMRDRFGRLALDHTSDEMSRRIFCMIAGPAHIVKQNQEVKSVSGESIDIVPTVAHLLGFRDQMGFKVQGRVLNEALV